MEHLTLKELADLNRIVKKQKVRYLTDSTMLQYSTKPLAECPAYIQKSRKRLEELSALQEKLERMILETEY